MIEIEINNADEIIRILDLLADKAQRREDLMRTLAGTMRFAVNQNFEAGGRPKWLGIKHRQGVPLNDSGALKNSINAFSDNHSAVVGTNLIYAPLHQFGGTIQGTT